MLNCGKNLFVTIDRFLKNVFTRSSCRVRYERRYQRNLILQSNLLQATYIAFLLHQNTYKYFTGRTQIPGEPPTYLMGPTTTRVFARVLFLLYRDFLLTKWTLWSRKGSEDIYYFVTCFFRRCTPQIHGRARTPTCPAPCIYIGRFATLLREG